MIATETNETWCDYSEIMLHNQTRIIDSLETWAGIFFHKNVVKMEMLYTFYDVVVYSRVVPNLC